MPAHSSIPTTETARQFLGEPHRLLIGGRWVEGQAGGRP